MYKKGIMMCCCAVILCAGAASARFNSQADADTLFVSTTFTPKNSFTSGAEGPAVDEQGDVYAVNFQKQSTVGNVTPQGAASLFIELPQNSTGNGIRFNSHEDMLIADYVGHNILKVDMETRAVSVYAHSDEMNQPNDIAIADNDMLFASDPNWSAGTGNIWRIDTDGSVHLLAADMGTTNGIEVSPDNKILYVNESAQRKVWAFDLSPAGDISHKRLLIEFNDFGFDGMRCDTLGNIYITRYGKGTVAIVSPQGVLLREVDLIGKKVSNIAFGGPDGRTCYVTLQDNGNIETFRTDTPGRSWLLRQKAAGVNDGHSSVLPKDIKLLKNYPNPFNPSTTISYQLAKISDLRLAVYDMLGKEVSVLVNGIQEAGSHRVKWDADGFPAGIYFYRLQAGHFTSAHKMSLTK